MSGIAEKIKQQEKLVAETKKKINDMKQKEAMRILRIAEKVGYFDVSIDEDTIRQALEQMVKNAKAEG